jgi:hypothetical protein
MLACSVLFTQSYSCQVLRVTQQQQLRYGTVKLSQERQMKCCKPVQLYECFRHAQKQRTDVFILFTATLNC